MGRQRTVYETIIVDDRVVLVGVDHGERNSYKLGCRCPGCSKAESDYASARRPVPAEEKACELADEPPPGDWKADGACVYEDLDMFFPPRGASCEPAKAICADCPVLEQCREYALSCSGALIGVWGGMSHKQRRIERARRKKLVEIAARAELEAAEDASEVIAA